MEIYSKENYNSFNEFKKAYIEELKKAFVGSKLIYRDQDAYFGDFYFSVSNLGEHLNAKIYVGNEEKALAILLALNVGAVKVNEDFNEYTKILAESYKIYNEEQAKLMKELDEQARIDRIKREEARKVFEAKKKAAEEEKKYQARIQKQLKKLEELRPEKIEKLFNSPTTYYEAIGWMAKHTTSIKASMPDYMEKWFDSKFDCENKNVVNSKKRTVNGHPMQWGLSFRMSFDEVVSGILEQRATSQNKKVIDNVAFVWDLIENYGFQFLKTNQDIERIKAEIPQEYITDFERGLTM